MNLRDGKAIVSHEGKNWRNVPLSNDLKPANWGERRKETGIVGCVRIVVEEERSAGVENCREVALNDEMKAVECVER